MKVIKIIMQFLGLHLLKSVRVGSHSKLEDSFILTGQHFLYGCHVLQTQFSKQPLLA